MGDPVISRVGKCEVDPGLIDGNEPEGAKESELLVRKVA